VTCSSPGLLHRHTHAGNDAHVGEIRRPLTCLVSWEGLAEVVEEPLNPNLPTILAPALRIGLYLVVTVRDVDTRTTRRDETIHRGGIGIPR